MAIVWFGNNYMKINSDKWNLLILDTKAEQVCAQLGNHKILKTRAVKFLGVTIDNNLKFDQCSYSQGKSGRKWWFLRESGKVMESHGTLFIVWKNLGLQG